MPAYSSSLLDPKYGLQPGREAYAWGSSVKPFTAQVTSVAKSSSVATVGLTLTSGSTPVAGQLLSIFGCQTAGGFNISGVAIASVTGFTSGDKSTGFVTFAIASGTVTTTADSGTASSQMGYTAVALATGKSQAFAIQAGQVLGGSYGVSWAYDCPSAPSSIAIQLEGAIHDTDAEYTLIGTSQTGVSGWTEVAAQIPNLINFVRLNITATTGGTQPTIVAKILNS
jgi:hypothetical protein